MKDLTPFERRIEILKVLQGKKMRIGELAEYFDFDERTLREDIKSLREGLNVLGTTVKIDSSHEGSQRHYYKSTVHPIFLALNLSELFALLKLLEVRSQKNNGEVYESLFQKIYSQMTDYAEGRISHLLKGEYEKKEIVNTLEEEVFNKDIKLVFWNKSQIFVEINYKNEENKESTEEVKLLDILDSPDIHGNDLLIEDKDGNQRWVYYGDLIIDWEKVEYK
ncbi:MAG: HTH domain-containing protein [Firmicutes bacterium]|jgi:predicted DNA-binding transcriptional regulator YafY|nr:HTH domain-containing protein [Bacillota bacterium]